MLKNKVKSSLYGLYDENGKYLIGNDIKKHSLTRWRKLFHNIVSQNDDNEFNIDEDIFLNSSIKHNPKDHIKTYLQLRRQRTQEITKQRKEKEKEKSMEIKEPQYEIPEMVIIQDSNQNTFIKDSDNDKDNNDDKIDSSNLLTINSENNNKNDNKDDEMKPMKIKFGVADFIKKVKDNEGMGISTFQDEDDGINKQNNKMKTSLQSIKFQATVKEAKEIMKMRKRMELTAIEKFQKGIKMVNMLNKAIRTSGEQTRLNNKKFMTFADYQDNAEQEKYGDLVFDTSIFKVKKEKTLNTEAIDIMKTDRNSRTEEMIHTAIIGLKSTVEAFGEFPIGMQQKLIEKGWYEKFEARRTIIRQGHNALNFYFIISGTTTVSVARHNKATGETYSETVAFLKKGNSFGELALMFGGKRSATVACKTDVELLSVSRYDFVDIFMSVSCSEEPEHISFLRTLALLKQWPIDELPYDDPSICLFTYFRRGTVLCHDSNNGAWVYIVKTGSCRIIKNIELTAQNELHEELKRDRKFASFITKDSLYGSQKMKKANSQIPPPPFHCVADITGKFYVQLSILASGSIFGLEPMAFEFVGGTTSVTFVSDGAELVAIEVNFFKKFMTRHYQSWLRKELQPFPCIEHLKSQLRNYYRWIDYRENLVQEVIEFIDHI